MPISFRFMRASRLSVFAFLAGTALQFAPAIALAEEGDSFVCKIDANGRFEEIFPEFVAFQVGSDDGGTLVMDAFINNYYKEPIEAQLLVDNDVKVKIRWTIKFVPDGGVASMKLQYELTFFKATKKASLKAKLPYGESHEPNFPGVCQRENWN